MAILFWSIFPVGVSAENVSSVPCGVDVSGQPVTCEASTVKYPGCNFSEADLLFIRSKLDLYRWHYRKFRSTMLSQLQMTGSTPYSDRVSLEKLGPIYSDNAQTTIKLLQKTNETNPPSLVNNPSAYGDFISQLEKNVRSQFTLDAVVEGISGEVNGFVLDSAGVSDPMSYLAEIPLEVAYIIGTVTLAGLNGMMDNFYTGFAELLMDSAWRDAQGYDLYEPGTQNDRPGRLILSITNALAIIDNDFSYHDGGEEANRAALASLLDCLSTQAGIIGPKWGGFDTGVNNIVSRLTNTATKAPIREKVKAGLNQAGKDPGTWVEELSTYLPDAILIGWSHEVKAVNAMARNHYEMLRSYQDLPRAVSVRFTDPDGDASMDLSPVADFIDHSGHEAYFIPPASPDLVVGSEGYATIQSAVDAAGPGAFIEIGPGTYNEQVIINKPGITLYYNPSNDINNLVIGKSSVQADTVLKPWAFKVTADNVTLANLRIMNVVQGVMIEGAKGCRIIGNWIQWHLRGIVLNEAHGCTIAGNNLLTSVDACIAILRGAGNEVYHNNLATHEDDSGAVCAIDSGANNWHDNYWKWMEKDGEGNPVSRVAGASYTITEGRWLDDRIYGAERMPAGEVVEVSAIVEGFLKMTDPVYVDFYFGAPDNGGLKINNDPVQAFGCGNRAIARFSWNTAAFFGAQDIHAKVTTETGNGTGEKIVIRPSEQYQGTSTALNELNGANDIHVASGESLSFVNASITWIPTPYRKDDFETAYEDWMAGPMLRVSKGGSLCVEDSVFSDSAAILFNDSAISGLNAYSPAAGQTVDFTAAGVTLKGISSPTISNADFGDLNLTITQCDGDITLKDLSAGDITVKDGPGEGTLTVRGCLIQNLYVQPGSLAEEASFGSIIIDNNEIAGGGIDLDYITANSIRVLLNHIDRSENSGNGISVSNCSASPIEIINNIIQSARRGIEGIDSEEVIVQGNTITGSAETGIYLDGCAGGDTSADPLVSQNTLVDCINGIRLTGCSNWAISGNSIAAPANSTGRGINIGSGSAGIIQENSIQQYRYGIWLMADACTLSSNTIRECTGVGLEVEGAANTTVYNNNFIDNDANAQDNGTDTAWYKPMPDGGNYWSPSDTSMEPAEYVYDTENGWRLDDGTGPVIGPIQVSNITGHTAMLQWDADEWSTAVVTYEAAGDSRQVNLDALQMEFSLSLTGLVDGAAYDVDITCADRWGNSMTATTQFSTPDVTPPVVSAVKVSAAGFYNVSISWTTNEPGTAQITCGIGTNLAAPVSAVTTVPDTSGSVTVFGLQQGRDYMVRVTATDSAGNTGHSEELVLFSTLALPVARIASHPARIFYGAELQLDGSSSSDADGEIVRYAWDFGDGTGEITSQPVATHCYDVDGRGGPKTIRLTVTDNHGGTGTATSEVWMGVPIIVDASREQDPPNYVYRSLSAAFNTAYSPYDAHPYDTIYVHSGIYSERVIVDNNVRIVGVEDPVIDGGGTGSVLTVINDECHIEGLTLTGAGVNTDPLSSDPNALIKIQSSNNFIENNTIKNSPGSVGIFVAKGKTGNRVFENYIENTGWGIVNNEDGPSDYTGTTVTGNRIYDQEQQGIYIQGTEALVERNIAVGCGEAGIFLNGQGQRAEGNICIDNGTGIMLNAWKNCSVENNFIIKNKEGLHISQSIQIMVGPLVCGNAFDDNEIQAVWISTLEESGIEWSGESGGNYWSDYTGADEDSDAIGDIPYYIDGVNQDPEPLMARPVTQETGPVIISCNANINEGYAWDELIVTGEAVDINGDDIRYRWQIVSGPDLRTNDDWGWQQTARRDITTSSTTLEWGALPPHVSEAVVPIVLRLTAADRSDFDRALTDTREITVNLLNRPPVLLLEEAPDKGFYIEQSSRTAGGIIEISPRLEDPDWNDVSFTFSQVSGSLVDVTPAAYDTIEPRPYSPDNVSYQYWRDGYQARFSVPAFDYDDPSQNEIVFSITATDENGASVSNTATILTVENSPPVDNESSAHTNILLDEGKTVAHMLDIIDPDGGVLNYVITTEPGQGTAQVDSEGNVTYTHAAQNTVTFDDFTVTATDRGSAFVTHSFSVFLTLVNDPPIGVDDTATVDEDSEGTFIDVLVNDSDPEGQPLLVDTASAQNGMAMVYNGGTGITYKPDTNFCGTDTIEYTIKDQNISPARTATANVTVTVTPVNDPPAPSNYDLSTLEDETVGIYINSNDPDPEDSHTFEITSGPSHGTAIISSDGLLEYSPAADYAGTDSITVTIADSGNATGTSEINCLVIPVNDPPALSLNPVSLEIDENSEGGTVQVMVTDPDEGDTHTFKIASLPSHAETCNISSEGVISYRPEPDYFGSDSLVVRVTDSTGLSSRVTVPVEVLIVNHFPAPTAAGINTNESGSGTTQIAANDPDTTDTHTYAVIEYSEYGNVTMDAGGQATYTPHADYSGNGVDSFRVRVTDQKGRSGEVVIGVVVEPVEQTVNYTEPMVSAGTNHSLALNEDGTVFTWGDNSFGQLGVDGTDESALPLATGISDIIQVAAGYDTSAALKKNGTVLLWGDNTYGQMADGTTGGNQSTPAEAAWSADEQLMGVVDLDCGDGFCVALKRNNVFWAWGRNEQGQMGVGNLNDSPIPVKSITQGLKLVEIDCGRAHSISIADDGSVYVWGANNAGQIGNDTINDSSVPYVIAGFSFGDTPAVAVAAGGDHSLMLLSDGTLYAWGSNSSGQLGIGTVGGSESTPVKVSLTNVPDPVHDIIAGENHSALITVRGEVYIWGSDADSSVPVPLDGLAAGVTNLSSSLHKLALRADGSVWAWGLNSDGQAGDSTYNSPIEAPVQVRSTDGSGLLSLGADTTAPVTESSAQDGAHYTAPLVVTLTATDNTDPAPLIYYTDDGTDPLTNGIVYTGPLTYDYTGQALIKFYAEDLSGNKEGVNSHQYDVSAQELGSVASPPGGVYLDSVDVVLQFSDDMSSEEAMFSNIFYTLDGTDPVPFESLEAVPGETVISITGDTTLKHMAVMASGMVLKEPVRTEEYIINSSAENVDSGVTPAGAYTGDIVTLWSGLTDPDGDAYTYEWEQLSGPTVAGLPATATEAELQVTLPGYDPDASAVSFRVTVSDGRGYSNISTEIVCEIYNSPPELSPSATPAVAGAGNIVTLDAGASDPDENDMTFLWSQSAGAPVDLSDTAAAGPTFTAPSYDPDDPDKNLLTFQVKATDNAGVDSKETSDVVTVEVKNTLPSLSADAISVQEDNPGTTQVNATDPDGGLFAYEIVRSPLLGTATVSSEGLITYTPLWGKNGDDSLKISVEDEAGGIAELEVDISIESVPTAAQLDADDINIAEDSTGFTTIHVTDPDEEDIHTFTITAEPVHGTGEISDKGLLAYTPNKDYHGTDSLTVRVDDSGGKYAEIVIDIEVLAVNDPPVAEEDAVETAEDTPVTIDVLANDSDPDEDTLQVSILSPPAHGTASVDVDGAILYTPENDYCGADSIIYTIDDSNECRANAIVNITVTPVNDPPSATAAAIEITEDEAGLTKIDVIDPDVPDSHNFMIVDEPSNGSAEVDTDGEVTYTPDEGFSGSDVIKVQVTDNGGESADVTIEVTVSEVDNPPVAVDDTVTTTEDTPVLLSGILSNDYDTDGDAVTLLSWGEPAKGSIAQGIDGVLTYTPAPDFSGTDCFYYRVTSGDPAKEAEAEVVITVTPVNDPPLLFVNSMRIYEDHSGIVEVTIIDPDTNDTHTLSVKGAPRHGSVNNEFPGPVTYTPNENYYGTDAFTLLVMDENNEFAETTVEVEIIEVGVYMETQVNVPGGFQLIPDDSGNVYSFSLAEQPENGTAVVSPSGMIIYTPAYNFAGNDVFIVSVSDETDGIDSEIEIDVTVTVEPGDINGDHIVGLADAVLALQILSGLPVTSPCVGAAVGGDKEIGIDDALYGLRRASEESPQ